MIVDKAPGASKQSGSSKTGSQLSDGANSYVHLAENKFLQGGQQVIQLKSGTHVYQVQATFQAAGCYQLKKIFCRFAEANIELIPLHTIEFRVRNVAPKVYLKDASKPIRSHVKSLLTVVATTEDLTTAATYTLDKCTCHKATVTLISRNVVLGKVGDQFRNEVDVDLEVFAPSLAEFHYITFHWILGTSKIVLTKTCMIPSKRPLVITPELLPGLLNSLEYVSRTF